MGFVRRARDRHFRAMCRCPSPRTTSNGLLRLGYSVHPTSLFRSHPVGLSRLDFLCFPLLYFITAFAELMELTRTDAPRNCTPMLAARPTMAEKKTEHFLSLPVSSVPVVLCSVLPPASAPPFHHIPRASAWKASRIAARARSIIARTTAQESLTPTGQVVKSFQKQRRW